MISSEKTTQALLAIRYLAIAARWCTGQKELDKVYIILDTLEHATELILDKNDNTEIFHEYLRDMAKRTSKINRALDVFESEPNEYYSRNPFFDH